MLWNTLLRLDCHLSDGCASWASRFQTQAVDECQRQAKCLTSNTLAWCWTLFLVNFVFFSFLAKLGIFKCLWAFWSIINKNMFWHQGKVFDVKHFFNAKDQMNTISTSVFDAIKRQTQAAEMSWPLGCVKLWPWSCKLIIENC